MMDVYWCRIILIFGQGIVVFCIHVLDLFISTQATSMSHYFWVAVVLKHMLFMMIYYGDKTSLNTLLRDVSENIGLKLIGSEADCLTLFPVHFFVFLMIVSAWEKQEQLWTCREREGDSKMEIPALSLSLPRNRRPIYFITCSSQELVDLLDS